MKNGLPLSVRAALPEDAAEIARLNLVMNEVNEPPENYAARLANLHRVDTPILAEVQGRAVGFAVLRLLGPVMYSEPYAELTEMFVEEAYRRQGVGKALIAFAEGIVRQAGASQMLVLTDFYNYEAQQLYRAAGFVHYDIALVKELHDDTGKKDG
jgi:GNAT superfamily N-acetyltransferase